jgi:hypothetical protein
MKGWVMKFTLSIGVIQNVQKEYDHTFEKKLEEKLRKLGISTRRCSTHYDIIEANWHFEGVLTDPDYISSRVDLLIGLVKDKGTITRFSIETNDVTFGKNRTANFAYTVCGDTVDIISFQHSAGMYLFQRKSTTEYSLESTGYGFQKMCEWFTVQASLHKAMEQGHTALTKHHRLADAAAKFSEGRALALQAFAFPPAIQ